MAELLAYKHFGIGRKRYDIVATHRDCARNGYASCQCAAAVVGHVTLGLALGAWYQRHIVGVAIKCKKGLSSSGSAVAHLNCHLLALAGCNLDVDGIVLAVLPCRLVLVLICGICCASEYNKIQRVLFCHVQFYPSVNGGAVFGVCRKYINACWRIERVNLVVGSAHVNSVVCRLAYEAHRR